MYRSQDLIMRIGALIAILEKIAPTERALESDAGRIGLIVEGREEVGTVACALDATPDSVAAAARAGAGLLVVHHTPLYTPATSVRGYTARVLRTILAQDMNLYVMHTNFDRAAEGINTALADLLGLRNVLHMDMGIVGDCTMSLAEMVQRLECPVRVYGNPDPLDALAVVGGSGFAPDLLDEAVAIGADAFLSAELKHATLLSSPIPCIEGTHYALESPGMRSLAERMGWLYVDTPPRLATLP
jgi:dinuclear metal center YbgI/SA1388 family protein